MAKVIRGVIEASDPRLHGLLIGSVSKQTLSTIRSRKAGSETPVPAPAAPVEKRSGSRTYLTDSSILEFHMDVRLAPFDLLVADICERTYEAKTPIGDLAFKVVGAALGIGLFLGLDEPAEAKRLLDPHPDANPDTASLESIVGSLVDQYVTPEYVAECRRLTAAQGLPVAILTTAYLVDSYQHSFGGLDESRRMQHIAGLANHALRFALRLAQRAPKVAREVKASQA